MFCPKLDPYIEEYIDKLAAILSMHDIKSITVARMEVPCCGGVNAVLERAMAKAGKRSRSGRWLSASGEISFMKIHYLQHVPFEGPAYLEIIARDRGMSLPDPAVRGRAAARYR